MALTIFGSRFTNAQVIQDKSSLNFDDNFTPMTLIIAVFVGIISSLIVAMFVEWMRKPRLTLSILPPEAVGLYGGDGVLVENYIALKVRVSNDALPFVFRWMQRQSARDCRATLRFLREDK